MQRVRARPGHNGRGQSEAAMRECAGERKQRACAKGRCERVAAGGRHARAECEGQARVRSGAGPGRV